MNNYEEENIVVLHDEEGNEIEFEFLDLVSYENEEYVVLISTDEDSDEVVILKVGEEDEDEETESYYPVEDEAVLEAVFGIFKERFADQFNFGD